MKDDEPPYVDSPIFTSAYEPKVPDGIYNLVYVRHKYVRAFGKSHKLFVDYRIVSEGSFFGSVMKRYYNVAQKRS